MLDFLLPCIACPEGKGTVGRLARKGGGGRGLIMMEGKATEDDNVESCEKQRREGRKESE